MQNTTFCFPATAREQYKWLLDLPTGLKMATSDKVVYKAPMWHWREESKSMKLSRRQLQDRQTMTPLLLLWSSYFSLGWLIQLSAHHWEWMAWPRACPIKQAYPDGLPSASFAFVWCLEIDVQLWNIATAHEQELRQELALIHPSSAESEELFKELLILCCLETRGSFLGSPFSPVFSMQPVLCSATTTSKCSEFFFSWEYLWK